MGRKYLKKELQKNLREVHPKTLAEYIGVKKASRNKIIAQGGLHPHP